MILIDGQLLIYLSLDKNDMSRKNKNLLKGISVLIVLLAVLMQLGYVSIVFLNAYKFWMLVIAYALLLVSSR